MSFCVEFRGGVVDGAGDRMWAKTQNGSRPASRSVANYQQANLGAFGGLVRDDHIWTLCSPLRAISSGNEGTVAASRVG